MSHEVLLGAPHGLDAQRQWFLDDSNCVQHVGVCVQKPEFWQPISVGKGETLI